MLWNVYMAISKQSFRQSEMKQACVSTLLPQLSCDSIAGVSTAVSLCTLIPTIQPTWFVIQVGRMGKFLMGKFPSGLLKLCLFQVRSYKERSCLPHINNPIEKHAKHHVYKQHWYLKQSMFNLSIFHKALPLMGKIIWL